MRVCRLPIVSGCVSATSSRSLMSALRSSIGAPGFIILPPGRSKRVTLAAQVARRYVWRRQPFAPSYGGSYQFPLDSSSESGGTLRDRYAIEVAYDRTEGSRPCREMDFRTFRSIRSGAHGSPDGRITPTTPPQQTWFQRRLQTPGRRAIVFPRVQPPRSWPRWP